MKTFFLIFKNLRRNKLRTLLTALAVMPLVFVFSFIMTAVHGIDELVAEKATDVKIMITERYRIPSEFDRGFVEQMIRPNYRLNQELRSHANLNSENYTVWHFAIFTLDPEMRDKDLVFFLVATIPEKLWMTDGMEKDVDPRWLELVKNPPKSRLRGAGIVLGADRAAKLKKNVGDVFRAKSISHREGTALGLPIEMEFEVVGIIPAGHRWEQLGFMDFDYLMQTLDAKKNSAADKVNMAFLQLDDLAKATAAGGIIEKQSHDLKAETLSAAYSRFLEPLKGLLWFMKWVLRPAIVIVMALILANTFSITVRERMTEMAVLKVLGFSSTRILLLVLGEAVLVGTLAGLVTATLSYCAVNYGMGGIKLSDQAQTSFMPWYVFYWGPAIGFLTSLAGGIVPALNARGVQVARAFANAT